MKRFLLIFFIFTLWVGSSAQNKSERRIYLWDVTLSMKGYQGKTPDIYDKIVKFLENEIKSITDESTEIIVCPFQETILETWKENATPSGKQLIINRIKNYKNDKVTGTNVVGPIQFAQNNLIEPDKHNLLILLTDGKQSGGNAKLLQLISEWESYADINNAFALYVMLTQEAVDEDIIKTINKTANIEVVTEPGQMEMLDLHPANPIKVNLKDNMNSDKMVSIPFSLKKGVTPPSNINIKVESDNPYFSVNEILILDHNKIAFVLDYKKDYNTLKSELSEITEVPVKISITNKDELRKAGKIVYLTRENITLEIINKPEKVLKISIKKK